MRARFALFAALVAAAAVVALAQDVDETDVLVLTPNNFDDALKEHSNILIEFYAPWCGHCKKLTPEYAQAATKLKENGIKAALAKVNADDHRDLGTRYGVQGFPTLKWFVNGKPSEYKGGRTASEIVTWVTKRTSSPVTALATAEDLKKFLASHEFSVVAFLEQSDTANREALNSAATANDELEFVVISDPAIAESEEASFPSVFIYRPEIAPYQSRRVKFEGEYNSEELNVFTTAHSLSLVTEFSPESAPKIFGSSIKTQVLLFSNSKLDQTKQIKDDFLAAAAASVGKAIFVTVEHDNSRVIEYFGVKDSEMPRVFVVRAEESGLKKFRMSDSPTKEGILSYLEDYFKNNLKPHRKSEPIPIPDENSAVKVLVADNFDSVVFDENKDVLVEFFAPWCGHCKELEPIYEKVAKELKPIESVLITKMDATANDAPESLDIRGFPTLVLFPAHNKPPVRFQEDKRTAKKIKQFLVQNAAIPFTLPSKKKGGDHSEL